jgi:hypothetical protein
VRLRGVDGGGARPRHRSAGRSDRCHARRPIPTRTVAASASSTAPAASSSPNRHRPTATRPAPRPTPPPAADECPALHRTAAPPRHAQLRLQQLERRREPAESPRTSPRRLSQRRTHLGAPPNTRCLATFSNATGGCACSPSATPEVRQPSDLSEDLLRHSCAGIGPETLVRSCTPADIAISSALGSTPSQPSEHGWLAGDRLHPNG